VVDDLEPVGVNLITKQCGRTVLPDCFVYLSCFPAFCVLSFLDNWLNTARIPVTEPLLLAWTVGLGTHNKRERTVTYLGGLLSPAWVMDPDVFLCVPIRFVFGVCSLLLPASFTL
jgi:hypothetical protein